MTIWKAEEDSRAMALEEAMRGLSGDLRSVAEAANAEVEQVRGDLAVTNGLLEEATNRAALTTASFNSEIGELKAELAGTNGLLETVAHAQGANSSAIDSLRDSVTFISNDQEKAVKELEIDVLGVSCDLSEFSILAVNRIKKNEIWRNWALGVGVLALLLVAVLAALTLPKEEQIAVVDPAPSGGMLAQGFDIFPPVVGWAQIIDTATHVCPEGCTYTTIQAAVDAASAGDTIMIHGGSIYAEDVVIPVSVNLVGWGADENNTTFSSVRIEGSVEVASSAGVFMNWYGITVYNFDGNAGGMANPYALKVDGPGNGINLNCFQCRFYANDDTPTLGVNIHAIEVYGDFVRLYGYSNAFAVTRGGANAFAVYADGGFVVLNDGSTISANTHDGGYASGARVISGGVVGDYGGGFEQHGEYAWDCSGGLCRVDSLITIENPISGTVTLQTNEYDTLALDLRRRLNYIASGSDYAIVPIETDSVYSNRTAVGDATFTLPAAGQGLHYCFYVYAAQNLYVDPAAGDQIHHLTDAAGDRILSSTVGDSICLLGLDTTWWIPLQEVGTWSDAN